MLLVLTLCVPISKINSAIGPVTEIAEKISAENGNKASHADLIEQKTRSKNLTESVAILTYQALESTKKAITATPPSPEFIDLIKSLGIQGIAAIAWQSGVVQRIFDMLPYGASLMPIVEQHYFQYQSSLVVATAKIGAHQTATISTLANHPIINCITYYMILNIITGGSSAFNLDQLLDALINGTTFGLVMITSSNLLSSLGEKLSTLYKKAPTDVALNQGQPPSPLHKAAQEGNIQAIKALLATKKPQANLQDESGNTPLHYALLNQHQEVAEIIIDALTTKTSGFLGFFQKAPTVRWLRNKNGEAPLYLAAKNGYTAIVERLCNHGALSEHNAGPNQEIPFLAAIKNNHITVVKFFLDRNIKDIDSHVDNNHNTALHIAAAKGTPEMIKMLLLKGANTTLCNKDGYTPFEVAAQNNNQAAINVLKTAHLIDLQKKKFSWQKHNFFFSPLNLFNFGKNTQLPGNS
jgi:ankyrin repeat protein